MMERTGPEKVACAPLPKWTPAKSIEVMDLNGIQTAITSLSAPGVHFGGGVEQARELAVRCNDFAAQMREDYTALSPSRYSMAALKALVELSHIRFGSDFPFAPAPLTTLQCRTLDEDSLWSANTQYGINRGNALGLFAHYRLPGEQVTRTPIYAGESFSGRIRRGMVKPLGALAERIRNR